MREEIRQILALRLIGLSPSCIAYATGFDEPKIRGILAQWGNVERRRTRYLWSGRFDITAERHRQFKLPAYVPLRCEGVAGVRFDLLGAITGQEPIVEHEGRRVGAYSGLAAFK